ncbi:MAG TPA: DUF6282 family protein [Amycolatopsis sp.]|nr:DUF6282 family protein [Amycolatopsis sp.]
MSGTGIELPGAVDMHLHYGPAAVPPEYSFITHSVTALEAARQAVEAGFAAIVLKAKDSVTAGVAHVVEEVVQGIRVFGGVVLDHPVGGLNPVAVEQTMLLGGKVVWLPTTGSRNDVELHGTPGPAIPITDGEGELLPVVHDIFDIVAAHDALLATGHVGFDEHLAIAREFGPSGRVIATHVGDEGGGPGLSAEECTQLAAYGVVMEFSGLTCLDHWGVAAMDMDRHAAMIRAVGVEASILSGDYGWSADLPRPVPGLQQYYEALWKAGFSEDELRLMACDTPARLLGLAA